MDWTEIVGFALGALCVWLTVRAHVANFPIGIAQCAFYIAVFWHAGLFADALLQFVFIAMGALGWHWWLRGGVDRTALRVTAMPTRAVPQLVAVTVLGTGVMAVLLDHLTSSTVPWIDALVTVLSLVAQFMLNRKWLQNWYVWIVTDVISVALYVYKGLDLTAVLYVGFLGLCVAGLVTWRRALPVARTEPALVLR